MSDVASELSSAKRRIIERLKRADSATAPELAAEFGFTDTAIRQHLEALENAELVERVIAPSSGRGRPPVHWRLAASASSTRAKASSVPPTMMVKLAAFAPYSPRETGASRYSFHFYFINEVIKELIIQSQDTMLRRVSGFSSRVVSPKVS